jgi:hypothetical protein
VLRFRRNFAKVNGVLITGDIAVLHADNRHAPQWEAVKEAPRQTIRRRLDEPKLEVGATVSLKDGATGVILARYIPSGRSDEVCYIVEVISDDRKKEQA